MESIWSLADGVFLGARTVAQNGWVWLNSYYAKHRFWSPNVSNTHSADLEFTLYSLALPLLQEKLLLQGVGRDDIKQYHFDDLEDAQQSDLAGNAFLAIAWLRRFAFL